MYFKEKENTNIDSEFENKKGFNFKKFNLKTILLIGGIIALLIVMILVFILTSGNSNKYTLELIGGERIIINLGDEFLEPGYKAYDKYNTDVSDLVIVTNNVDSSTLGEYEILYSIGHVDRVRYVTVAKTIEDIYLYLKGDINMYLELGEKYQEPGYQAQDSNGDDLTGKVKKSGNVNVNKVGTYQITYSVVNSKNVMATKKRTVTVVEKGGKPQK